LRAKFVFEKFQEKSDPIYDLGIGFNVPMNFDSMFELSKYLVCITPLILKMNEIPEDILQGNGYIKDDYYYTILEYIDKFITYQKKPLSIYRSQYEYSWPYYMRQILLEMGFEPQRYFSDDKIKK